MNKKAIEEAYKTCEVCSKKWYELSLRDMVNSCYAYGYTCDKNNHYITRYYEDKELTEKRVWKIVEDQLDFLNNKCKVVHSVGYDNEGICYNGIVEL